LQFICTTHPGEPESSAMILAWPHSAHATLAGSIIGLFFLKRLATFVATLVAASLVIFAVLDILPGNAADVMLGESATAEARQALIAKLGLDQPAPLRYAAWLKGLLTGELGATTPTRRTRRSAATSSRASGARTTR
jgi:ABC-type dipeptide/oligopeptide/nickel transport system permease component